MSVQGRTTPRWGRDKSARWDPGPTNKKRSYPAVELPGPKAPVADMLVHDHLPGRRGATERALDIHLTHAGVTPMRVEISLDGWFRDRVELNERQVRYLRDALDRFLILHDELLAEFAEAV